MEYFKHQKVSIWFLYSFYVDMDALASKGGEAETRGPQNGAWTGDITNAARMARQIWDDCWNYKVSPWAEKETVAGIVSGVQKNGNKFRGGLEPTFRTEVIHDGLIHYKEMAFVVDGLSVGVRPEIRLFDSGLGTCRLEVNLDPESSYSTKEVHRILRSTGELEGGDENSEAGTKRRESADSGKIWTPTSNWPLFDGCDLVSSDGKRKAIRLFDIFLATMRNFFGAFALPEGGLGDELRTRSAIRWSLLSQMFPEREEEYALEWLDRMVVEETPREEFQHPYVVVVSTIPETQYAEIFLKDWDKIDVRSESRGDRPSAAVQEVLGLMLREVMLDNLETLDDSFIERFCRVGPDLMPTNMNLNSRLFMHFHHRATVVFMSDEFEGMAPEKRAQTDPSRFILPSLKGILELIRTRWHMSVIINASLDFLLRHLRAARAVGISELRELVERREKLAHVLEDPASFTWGGGSLKVMYDEALASLRIEMMEEASLKKFDLARALYRDILLRAEMQRHKELWNEPERSGSQKGKRKLWKTRR